MTDINEIIAADNPDRTPAQNEAVVQIMRILLDLPFLDRQAVFSGVRYNSIICAECGTGDLSDPNENCQCWNDE